MKKLFITGGLCARLILGLGVGVTANSGSTGFDGEGVFFRDGSWVLALQTDEGGFVSFPRDEVVEMTPEMQESLGIEVTRTGRGWDISTPNTILLGVFE